MKKTLFALLFTTLTVTTFFGCASDKDKPAIKSSESNRFRTLNANSQVGERTVVCHNCTAQFKLSARMQKMSMKGDAIIPCPVCHHNYLKKATEDKKTH
jgi:hypothetical protein